MRETDASCTQVIDLVRSEMRGPCGRTLVLTIDDNRL